MRINTVEEFWEALNECVNFAHEHESEGMVLFAVAAHESEVGFLISGKGEDIVPAICCVLDENDACRAIWSETSVAYARASAKVKPVTPQTVGEFPINPSKIKS